MSLEISFLIYFTMTVCLLPPWASFQEPAPSPYLWPDLTFGKRELLHPVRPIPCNLVYVKKKLKIAFAVSVTHPPLQLRWLKEAGRLQLAAFAF